jgi:hypothetical protein
MENAQHFKICRSAFLQKNIKCVNQPLAKNNFNTQIQSEFKFQMMLQ